MYFAQCLKILGALKDTKNLFVEEIVTIFLHVLAFDKRNRSIKYDFQQLGETVSRHFHDVLKVC